MLHPSYRETRQQEAVTRVGRKGAAKIVFKKGRKSPWVPTKRSSWLCAKNALYYCAQSINSISRVLFVCSYTTAIVSPLWYLFGSWTKEIHAVRKVSVRYKTRPWIQKTATANLETYVRVFKRCLSKNINLSLKHVIKLASILIDHAIVNIIYDTMWQNGLGANWNGPADSIWNVFRNHQLFLRFW